MNKKTEKYYVRDVVNAQSRLRVTLVEVNEEGLDETLLESEPVMSYQEYCNTRSDFLERLKQLQTTPLARLYYKVQKLNKAPP